MHAVYLVDGLNIKVIIVIVVIVGFILSISVVLFSIAIDVIRFISLSILISLCNNNKSSNTNEGHHYIDEIVDKTTNGKNRNFVINYDNNIFSITF